MHIDSHVSIMTCYRVIGGPSKTAKSSSAMKNRIFFTDNPWPAGHAVENLVWDGRLEPDGTLWFDLHLETADYDADDREEPDDQEEEDEEDEGAWTSKTVWTN